MMTHKEKRRPGKGRRQKTFQIADGGFVPRKRAIFKPLVAIVHTHGDGHDRYSLRRA